MARLIDADALSYRLEKRIDSVTDLSFAEGLSEAIVEVGLSPTISPDEVRGVGEWERAEYEDNKFWANYCSLCYSYLPYGLEWKPNYCPNCGARMKGADEDTRKN